MKALIDGIEREVKTTENMGFQGGYYTRAIEYDGKERIIQKIGGAWQTRTPQMRIGY